MAEDTEYEVDYILRAKVHSHRGGKRFWKYYVKWKGFGEGENTWEPPDSFDEESQHFIDSFWGRIRDKRNYEDMSLFKLNEEILPTGPPRRAKKSKPAATADAQDPGPSGQKNDSENEVSALVDDEPISQRKRRNHSLHETPPPKRVRETPPPPRRPTAPKGRSVPLTPKIPEMRSKGSQLLPATKRTTSRNVSGPSSSTRKAPAPQGPPVEIVSDSEKEEEVDIKVPYTPETNQGESSRSVAPAVPLKVGPPRGVKSMSSIPAHRARAANPRVKMMDQPFTKDAQGSAIDTKARLTARMREENGSTAEVIQPETSRNKGRPGKAKAGPGRSSAGLQSGSLARILPPVINRGPLPVPRRPTATPSPRKDSLEPTHDNIEEDAIVVVHSDDEDVVMQDNTDDLPKPHDAAGDVGSESPVTCEQPVSTAGVDITDVQTLPDFEEAAVADPTDSVINQGDPTETDIIKEVQIAEVSKPPPRLTASFFVSGWKQPTIFGPLGIGRGESLSAAPKASSTSALSDTKPTLPLVLNSEVDIPVVLKDVCAATSPNLKSLNELAVGASRGPPGKFYKREPALELVGALRAGGSCARIALEKEDENLKTHFKRFQSRLNDGELFASMVGGNLIVFCSSENAVLGAKLGMPQNLMGLAGNILATEVAIENDSAYLDAVMRADTGRW